ncbi:MAG: radical SAM family heme chaperone HemW [Chthonomonas sp.]|nr:radical SAM family heme chaperone HemW [Chthonomonas sp.]
MAEPIAVYVHVPFCPSKCGYCDFNSYAMTGDIHERTVQAMEREILSSPIAGRPAKTVFFGGGTPTFLSSEQICRLLAAVLATHPPVAGCEITSEGNPGTVDTPKFAAMREAGFNRLSLGAQSFASGDLMRLGRVHDASDIGRAVLAARQAGFDNLNLDLIFGLPGQTPRAWANNLELAMLLRPEHLSLYGLTIEANTRFYRYDRRGLLNLPSEDDHLEMLSVAARVAHENGLGQYEISNFARPGRECQHNLCYWRAEEYAGYGPGAVGRVGRRRSTNMKHPERYCDAVEQGAELSCDGEDVTDDMLAFERVMLGLRLNDGVAASEPALDSAGVERALARDWVAREGDRLVLTAAGRPLCNQVLAEIL